MLTPTKREPCPFCKMDFSVVQKRPRIKVTSIRKGMKTKVEITAQVLAKVIDENSEMDPGKLAQVLVEKLGLCRKLIKEHYKALITLEDHGSWEYSVYCHGCNSMGPYCDDIVEAIDAWNMSAMTIEQVRERNARLWAREAAKARALEEAAEGDELEVNTEE